MSLYDLVLSLLEAIIIAKKNDERSNKRTRTLHVFVDQGLGGFMTFVNYSNMLLREISIGGHPSESVGICLKRPHDQGFCMQVFI